VILAAGSVVAGELYRIECPIVELDRAAFDVVTQDDNGRLLVDAWEAAAVRTPDDTRPAA
jgi:hypothetical protein